MKIIGKSGDNFICVVSEKDVSSILELSDKRRQEIKKLNVGDELTFTSALTRLREVKALRISGEYKSLNERANDLLEKAKQVVETIVGLESELIGVKKNIREEE